MVWFLLGGKLTKESLRGIAPDVLLISALLSAVLFSLGLICIGVPQGAVCYLVCITSVTASAAA